MSDDDVTRPTVVYGNDVLCGWCFATGPQIAEAKRRLGDAVDWRVECGGLVVGDRVRPIAADREYLVAGLAQVASVTGRRAGERYYSEVLSPGTWVSASEPACRAVLVAQEMRPEAAVDFSHWLTDALYLDGRVPDDPSTLRDACAAHGIDDEALVTRWGTPGAAAMTRNSFSRARRLGVNVYPSLFLQVGAGPLEPLVEGYAPADDIEATIREALVGSRTARR